MKFPTAFLPPSAKKRWIYGMIAALLCAAIFIYGYSQLQQPADAQSPFTPEQLYYQDMIFAVNEMNNQLEKWNSLRTQGKLEISELDEPAAYVETLMSDLASPPEELVVAQSLAEDLYNTYQQYVEQLRKGNPETDKTYEQAVTHYDKFLENANLIAMLGSYSGLDVYCH